MRISDWIQTCALPIYGLEGLVHGEARRVARDLEQVAARLAEIERAEVIPLDLARGPDAGLGQMLRPVVDRGGIRDAEGDVMHPARALTRDRQAGLDRDMQFGRRAAVEIGRAPV